MRWDLAGLALLLGALATGCPSTYDRAYEEETQRLEGQERARQEERRAAVEEASRYAAVVYFEVGSAVIKEEGYRELSWFADKVRDVPEAVIQVQGFADSTGGDATNQRLSEQRAQAVARYLENQGIRPSRLVVQGFASEFAAQPNTTAAGRVNNRRVEVTVR